MEELKEESAFSKIPAETFEAGDFLNIFGFFLGGGIFQGFEIFEAHFLIKVFLIKKHLSETNKSTV